MTRGRALNVLKGALPDDGARVDVLGGSRPYLRVEIAGRVATLDGRAALRWLRDRLTDTLRAGTTGRGRPA